MKIITIVKLIDHILKTLPQSTSQFELIIQDHKLMRICKTILKRLTKKIFFDFFSKPLLTNSRLFSYNLTNRNKSD